MFANEKKRIEVNFVDGLEQGLKVVWYQEGKKQSEGMLKKGRHEGKLTTWFPDGQKEMEAIYQNGKETSRQEWDENGKPVPDCLIEIWQANAGGRYRHKAESYRAPLDPNFGGCGRTITAADGSYEFITIRPAAYPFPNGPNSWRPAHIHFSLFGDAFAQRLVTQMYFEGDPLIPLCPIVETLPDQDAIRALTALYDPEATLPMDMQAYRFDIVLRGRSQTLFENRMEGL